MRRINIVIFLSLILFAGCKKDSDYDCTPVNLTVPDSEVEALRSYISTNAITATEDPRGFFYNIITAGGADKPTACDRVTVNYKGMLTNGTQFDAADNATFDYDHLIIGWQEALPLIGSGGTITLYLPPTLGYGNTAYGDIPPNSILVFDINLTAIE